MTVVVSNGKAVTVGDVKAWPLAGIEQRRALTSSRALELIGLDYASSYANLYASQPWIYAVVNKITRNIARLPLRGLAENPDTLDRSPLPRSHDLPALLSRPHPRGSTFSLIEATVGSLCVFSHALWWKYRERPGQPPVELWPLAWQNVSIEAGDTTPIDHYVYAGPRGRKRLMPDDVVHFTWWSPAGLRGTSPLEALRSTLSLEDAQRRYSTASFANGIRPSGALVSERALGDEAKKELRAELELAHSTPDNAFRMMLLDGGLTWQQFAQSAVDAQSIEHRKLNQIEVCAAFDMPPTMLQILDHATFSNIDEQHRMLYQDTLGPVVANLEATIGAQLLWGEPVLANAVVDGGLENTLVAFDMDDVLRADIVKRAAAYAAMRAAGGLTINDIRRAEGKRPITHPAANAVLVPLNMEVVGDEGSSAELGLAPRADAGTAALMQLADQLGKQLDGKVSELALELKAIEGSLRSSGADDMAASVAELAKALADREPVRIELEPRHHHHEAPAVDIAAELRGVLDELETPPTPDVAAELRAALLERDTASKHFEYDDHTGLMKTLVVVGADGTETRHRAIRDDEGKLTRLEKE